MLTFASGIPEGELRNVKVVFSAAADPFANTTYYGTVKRNQNNQYWAVFETVISNSFITGRYRSSTNQWYWVDQISSLINKKTTIYKNISDLNITAGGKLADFIYAMSGNSIAIIETAASSTFTDVPNTGILYIFKPGTNSVFHKTMIMLYTASQSSISLTSNILFGFVPYSEDHSNSAKWYRPTLTEVT